MVLRGRSAQACVEDARKNQCVKCQHEQRLYQRPEKTQYRTFVPTNDFSMCHAHNQLAVLPKAGHHGFEVDGIVRVRVHRCTVLVNTRRRLPKPSFLMS